LPIIEGEGGGKSAARLNRAGRKGREKTILLSSAKRWGGEIVACARKLKNG